MQQRVKSPTIILFHGHVMLLGPPPLSPPQHTTNCFWVLVFYLGVGGVERCALIINSGPCEAATPRYAYNMQTSSCELFMDSGCPGNSNNFATIQECTQACSSGKQTNIETKFAWFCSFGCLKTPNELFSLNVWTQHPHKEQFTLLSLSRYRFGISTSRGVLSGKIPALLKLFCEEFDSHIDELLNPTEKLEKLWF